MFNGTSQQEDATSVKKYRKNLRLSPHVKKQIHAVNSMSEILTSINSLLDIDICMATLTPVLYRAFSASTSRRFGARLPPLLGRDSRRWWQHLESHKGAAASAGTAELRALQLSWEIHGEGRARRAKKWRAFRG